MTLNPLRAYAGLVKLLLTLGGTAFVLLAASRLLTSRGELAARAAAAGARADSLERALADTLQVLERLRQEAAAAVPAHVEAMARTDAGRARLEADVARARAAADADALTLEASREELRRLAASAEAFARLHAIERQASSERIRPLEEIAVRVPVTRVTVEELVGARREQLQALGARDRWWRRVLVRSCEVTITVAGAAAGAALAAGPAGAAVGAGAGFLSSVLACP